MVKAFNLWLWQNSPSVDTPLGKSKLNLINRALDEVDSRVVNFDTTKANQTDLLTAVADVTFDEITGIFTITKKNGAVKKIDTKLEKLAINFTYDSINQQLVIHLDDGTYQYVDLRALITELEFLNSNTVLFSVTNGKVTANIAQGSITADMLEPNYLANVQLYASQALSSANVAESYAVGGTGTRDGEDTDNAKYYSEVAGNLIEDANTALNEAKKTLEEVDKKVTETTFHVNLETGKLEYDSPNYSFTVNNSTGKLEWEVA